MIDKALRSDSRIVLIDNGSLNPESILQARGLAGDLSDRIGRAVDHVSVSHSDEIPADELRGIRAERWDSYLSRVEAEGIGELLVVPLFIGPGFGLRKAKQLALKREHAKRKPLVRWADTLVSRSSSDAPLIELLSENVIRVLDTLSPGVTSARVLLVDHGSPYEDVTECRNFAAEELSQALGDRVESVVPCSMERRDGRAFDFNEPSLERALRSAREEGSEHVVLCYLFLFPGRHAGPGGDIDQICGRLGWSEGVGLSKAELIGGHPQLLRLLELRLNSIRNRT